MSLTLPKRDRSGESISRFVGATPYRAGTDRPPSHRLAASIDSSVSPSAASFEELAREGHYRRTRPALKARLPPRRSSGPDPEIQMSPTQLSRQMRLIADQRAQNQNVASWRASNSTNGGAMFASSSRRSRSTIVSRRLE